MTKCTKRKEYVDFAVVEIYNLDMSIRIFVTQIADCSRQAQILLFELCEKRLECQSQVELVRVVCSPLQITSDTRGEGVRAG